MSSSWFDFSGPRSVDYEIEAAIDAGADLAADLEGDELRAARRLLSDWASTPGGLSTKLRQLDKMTADEKQREVAAAFHAIGKEAPAERRARLAAEAQFAEAQFEVRAREARRPLMKCVVCGAH